MYPFTSTSKQPKAQPATSAPVTPASPRFEGTHTPTPISIPSPHMSSTPKPSAHGMTGAPTNLKGKAPAAAGSTRFWELESKLSALLWACDQGTHSNAMDWGDHHSPEENLSIPRKSSFGFSSSPSSSSLSNSLSEGSTPPLSASPGTATHPVPPPLSHSQTSPGSLSTSSPSNSKVSGFRGLSQGGTELQNLAAVGMRRGFSLGAGGKNAHFNPSADPRLLGI